MKRIAHYIVLCTLSLCTFSCRPQGDDLLSYGQDDFQAFMKASGSYEGQFEAFWQAMNNNYCIWDFEEANGVDWDQVHTEYLPRFRALDDTTRQSPVSDNELKALYTEVIDRLHDGHLYIEITNRDTKKKLSFIPSENRNMRERGDELRFTNRHVTDLHYYLGEGTWKMLDYDHADRETIAAEQILHTMQNILANIDPYMATLPAEGTSVATDSLRSTFLLLKRAAERFITRINQGDSISSLITDYNSFCNSYWLQFSLIGIEPRRVDKALGDKDELKFIRYALFPGNIAYLRLSGFSIGGFLDPEMLPRDTSSLFATYHRAVYRVWHNWFDTIQALSSNNQLGGVIIDVRNNPGGSTNDYQYVLGALMPSSMFASHTMRTKNGLGRLDFAPTQPYYYHTYMGEHAVIEQQPVVVLANISSISMAEITSWGAKNMPGKNGRLIGTRTWGGLSSLQDTPAAYSTHYSGCIGVSGETPFYAYIPKFVSLFGEKEEILEGIGITPDIEVPLDTALYLLNGQDTQLERALQYITTGN